MVWKFPDIFISYGIKSWREMVRRCHTYVVYRFVYTFAMGVAE